jgi:hypothetical protein
MKKTFVLFCLVVTMIGAAYGTMTLPAAALSLTAGTGYTFKVHNNPNNKNWTATITFTSFANGNVTGQIDWPSEHSINGITGTYRNGTLNFRETSRIKPGGAHLNCDYTLKFNSSSSSFEGTWYEDGSTAKYNGSCSFSLSGNGSTSTGTGAWVFKNVRWEKEENTGSTRIVAVNVYDGNSKLPRVVTDYTYKGDGGTMSVELAWDAPPSVIQAGQPLNIRFMIKGTKANKSDHTMSVGGGIFLTADYEGSGGGASIGGFDTQIDVARYSSGSFDWKSKVINATLKGGKPGMEKTLYVRAQGPGGKTVFYYTYAWQ